MRYIHMLTRRFKLLAVSIFLLFPVLQAGAQQSLKDIDPSALFNKGMDLFGAGMYASAEKVFIDYLNTNDNSRSKRADATYYIAVSAIELYQDDAEGLLIAFNEQYPDNPRSKLIYYNLGKFYYRKNEFQKAADAYDKVTTDALNVKELPEYYFSAGFVNFKIEKYARAKEYFGKIKDGKSDLSNPAAYYYGYIAYKEDKYTEAIKEFERIKDDKRFKTQIPEYITQIYLLEGDYDKVISFGESAMKDKETVSADKVHLYVAEAYFLKKNYPMAVDNYKSYSGQLTTHHMYQLGYAQMVQQQYADAIQSFSGIQMAEDSIGQSVAYNLGVAYITTGDKLKALNSYEFASKLKFNQGVKEISMVNMAKANYELGNQKESVDGLRAFLKSYPRSKYAEEAKELLAEILMSADDPKASLEILKAIPDRGKKLNEAYQKSLYTLSMDLINNSQDEEALKNLRESLDNPVDNKLKANAFFWIAELEYKEKEYAKAIINYKNFLGIPESQSSPYHSQAYYNLGFCFFKQQSWAIAADYFRQYTSAARNEERSPMYSDAILRSADCNFMLRNYPAALQHYEEAVNANSPDADYALYQESVIYGLQEKTTEQIATLKKLIRNYDKSNKVDDAYFSLGETYTLIGENENAIRTFEKLNSDYPKNPYKVTALANIGMSYYNMGQNGKAKEKFNTIIKEYSHSEQAKFSFHMLQNICRQSGSTDCLDSLPRENFVNTSRDSLFYATAFANYDNNDCDKAIKAFKTYLEKFKDPFFFVDANYFMAQCELDKGALQEASAHFDKVIAKSPNQYMENSLYNSAILYYDAKNYDMAQKRYIQLGEIASTNDNTIFSLVGILKSSYLIKAYDKCEDAANKILSTATATDATKLLAQFYLAKCQFEQNKMDLAMASFTQVYQKDKSENGAEAMYNVAYINYLNNNFKEVESLVIAMKDKFKLYDFWKAKGLILVADIYAKNGNDFQSISQAKATLQSVIKKTKNEEIKKIAQEKLDAVLEKEKQLK